MTIASVLVLRNELPATNASERFLRALGALADDGHHVEILTFALDPELAGRLADWEERGLLSRLVVRNAHIEGARSTDRQTPRTEGGGVARGVGIGPDTRCGDDLRTWRPGLGGTVRAWWALGRRARLGHLRTVVQRLLASSATPSPDHQPDPRVSRVRRRLDSEGRVYQCDYLDDGGRTYLVGWTDRVSGKVGRFHALDPRSGTATAYRTPADWNDAWLRHCIARTPAPILLAAFSPWGIRTLERLEPSVPTVTIEGDRPSVLVRTIREALPTPGENRAVDGYGTKWPVGARDRNRP